MCSSGGPMAELSMKKLKTKKYKCLDCGNEKLKTKKYKCLDCGNDFKGLGKKVICPSCQSDNVEAQE